LIDIDSKEIKLMEVIKMEFMAYLAPVAFVFALSAIAQTSSLRKQVEQLKNEIEKLKQ